MSLSPFPFLGRRVTKTVFNGGLSGTITNATYRYLYDGDQIIEELLVGETTTTLRQFVWGQYIDELVQMMTYADTGIQPLSAGSYYPLQDLLYRTTALTDSDGNIVEAYDYDAYGNTLMFSVAGSGGTDWWADDCTTTLQPACEYLFTGRQYDPETEIYSYRARYYSPPLGRFLGRDHAGLYDPNGLYQYVKSAPTAYLDPSGLIQVRAQAPPVLGGPMVAAPPLFPPNLPPAITSMVMMANCCQMFDVAWSACAALLAGCLVAGGAETGIGAFFCVLAFWGCSDSQSKQCERCCRQGGGCPGGINNCCYK
jgi:RHS repeat-associated protein